MTAGVLNYPRKVLSEREATIRAAVVRSASTNAPIVKLTLTGQVGSLGAQTMLAGASSAAAMYRISFYIKTTTAVAVSSMTVTVSWNDGTAQTLVVPFVNMTVIFNAHDLGTNNAFSQGSVVVRAAAGTNISFITTVTSGGAPAYSIASRLESLG